MSIIKRYWKKDFNSYLVAFGVAILTAIFPKYSIDIWILSFLLIICFGLFFRLKESKYKIIQRIFGVYVLSNFIIFPFIYLFALKKNPNSFQFDPTIFSSEKESSLKEIESYYDPNKLDKSLRAIDLILSDSSQILDTTVIFLNNGNIIALREFIISKNCESVGGAGRPMYKARLNICDSKGIQITSLQEKIEGCRLGKSGQSIRSYLSNFKEKYTSELNAFKTERKQILNENDIWTYKQLLPYSINIFSTSNIVPKSRIANIIFHFHQFLVGTIIISLLVNFFPGFFISKKD